MKRSEQEFIAGISQEAKIPDIVIEKANLAFAQINTRQAINSETKQPKRKKGTHLFIKGLGVTVAVFAGFLLFCISNPVMAAKIPFIGKIFFEVEKDVSFSGDYSEKADILTTENVDTGELENTDYKVTNGDITLTASEVYCDGYSIFLTMNLTSEQGGFKDALSYYTDQDTLATYLYTWGNWSFGESGENIELINNFIEGKAVSDNSFIGMIKIDLPNQDKIAEDLLHLNFTKIGYDKEDMQSEEGIGPSVEISGNWDFTIPIQVNSDGVQEIMVEEANKEGFGVSKVLCTPSQVIVYRNAPYTTLDPSEYTIEEFEKVWGKKNEEIAATGDEPITYESQLNEKRYEDFGVSVFDQTGTKLQMMWECDSYSVFAVKGREISKLSIFLGKDAIMTMKETNMEAMRGRAMYSTEVSVDKK